MAVASNPLPDLPTLADVIEHLGGVPPERIRLRPMPGTATERDVIELREREDRLAELVDGILVEKAVGFYEALLATILSHILWDFVESRDLGLVVGADGMMRLAPGLVRIPDVAFLSWERLGGVNRREPIPDLAPDLAVEVLSRSNTRREMARKCREYFEAGVRRVWYLDPEARCMTVYTSPEQSVVIGEEGTLDGGDVLPGFTLPLRDLFARADHRSSAE